MDSGERYHALDALRGVALALGVMLHAAISFVPDSRAYWCVQDRSTSAVATALFFVIHTFRLAVFFVMAGFFARLVVSRKGQAQFIRDRLRRILVPLVVGWFVVYPLIVWVWIAGSGIDYGVPGWVAALGALATGAVFAGGIPAGHLWFLYYLLLFYALLLLARHATVEWCDRAGRVRAWLDGTVRRLLDRWWAPVVPALPVMAGMLWGGELFGIRTADRTLVPQGHVILAYGAFVVLGWLLHRQPALLEIFPARWSTNLSIAALLSAGLLQAGWTAVGTPTRLAISGGYALAMCFWVFGVLGIFLRYLSSPSPVRRYLADSSYWIYIVHLPLVCALQVAVAPLSWHWSLKFVGINLLCFPLLLFSYQYLVRHTFIGATLNGRRAKSR